MNILNILVVGTGMYVCGKGTDGYGTIMPAICEWKRGHYIGEVCVAGKSSKSVRVAMAKVEQLQKKMNVRFSVKYLPSGKDDPKCYKEAMRNMPKPACVIVAVPDNLHKKIAAAAITEGLHTLVVKPLAPTTKEISELLKLQQKNNVYCAVEFHKRFDSANLMLRDAILKGKIGDPLYFLVEYSQRKTVPFQHFSKWVTRTNVFQYLGIHYVDIIYFATNAMPKRVMALGQKNWLLSKGINAYDSIQGIIEWRMPSGKYFTSCILTNWIDPETSSAMSDQRIMVVGTKGRFDSDQKRRGVTIVSDERGVEEPNPYFCRGYDQEGRIKYYGYGIESTNQFLDDVVQIEEGTIEVDDLEDKRPTFKQSAASTLVLEGINKSLKKNGAWVEIKDA